MHSWQKGEPREAPQRPREYLGQLTASTVAESSEQGVQEWFFWTERDHRNDTLSVGNKVDQYTDIEGIT